MGTRSTIARKVDGGFKGVYHHWDGYPTSLGKTLYKLFNTHFERDLPKMLKTLIDDHPAGWSTINNRDFTKNPGYTEYDRPTHCSNCGVKLEYLEPVCKACDTDMVDHRPNCYCHGTRDQKGWEVTHENASASGCEYAYAFDEKTDTMYILSSYTDIGSETGKKDQKMIGMFGVGDKDAIWKPFAEVKLRYDEPDWEEIESKI